MTLKLLEMKANDMDNIESLSSKHVVLVNEENKELGILDKFLAHNSETPLHRGFSAFIFNYNNEILIQKRASSKKTWPGFWSNSFCGHPQLGESNEQAVIRHAKYELNISKLENIKLVYNYKYKFSYNNIVENEICPVYLAKTNDIIIPNNNEVEDFKWLSWADFLNNLKNNELKFTPWCIEETKFLHELVHEKI